ncbi:hypothetical protein K438DRAFT_1996192 [Mycena galopus ATCC 62051]|nr:hypothetical protein K438DRAFT_1996192 [Mycena galopus ATCC 62051]
MSTLVLLRPRALHLAFTALPSAGVHAFPTAFRNVALRAADSTEAPATTEAQVACGIERHQHKDCPAPTASASKRSSCAPKVLPLRGDGACASSCAALVSSFTRPLRTSRLRLFLDRSALRSPRVDRHPQKCPARPPPKAKVKAAAAA